jgi:hypothetical protein
MKQIYRVLERRKHGMKVLYYGTTNNGAGKRLQKVIESVVPIEDTEVYRDVEELGRRLRLPTCDVSISVFLTKSKAELFDLILMKKLLLDMRILLVLPDGDNETITMGHTLFPRFLTYMDSDFKDVEAVLKKIIQKEHSDS